MARIITVRDSETWESSIDGVIWVKRFDRRGDVVDEQVKPHGKLVITPDERRYNQELVVSAGLDPFQNGMLVPLSLVETAEDYEALKGNPNHLTEQDMSALLANPKQMKALEAALSQVANPTTLQRMLAVAESSDVTTIGQIKVIRDRIAEVSSQPIYEEVQVMSTPSGREVFGTKAPESQAPSNPGMGRR